MVNFTTAERVSSELSDNFVFQRSKLAYYYASGRVEGSVLEIGTGSGYGIDIIAPNCTRFVTIDKLLPNMESDVVAQNVEMISATTPPIPFANNTFDCVVSFQVIEHIDKDTEFVKEIYRVLKPNGVFIVSTPNAPMSLTRNPWHIREYNNIELSALLATKFDGEKIECLGVNGNDTVMEYYNKNREAVEKITRFDILDLQHRLPRWMLLIPYDILNRINRRRLLEQNRELTSTISMSDYSINEVCSKSFDLLYIAHK